jgi:DNA-binding transcriptional LysR family regulator
VELSVSSPSRFEQLLLTRAADVAIGPRPAAPDPAVVTRPVMNYQIVLVVGPDHVLATAAAGPPRLREQTWLLGPSAAASVGTVPALLRRLAVPEDRQQIFQSHAAAIEEAKRNKGVAPVLSLAVAQDLTRGQLIRVTGTDVHVDGVWHTMRLATSAPAAAELTRFASTPRAIQAMVRGTGVNVGRFKPSIHVTLWS